MRFTVIYRADTYGGIGKDNKLPTVCPPDMGYFSAITKYVGAGSATATSNLLVFGNRTYSYSGVSIISDAQRKVAVITRDPANVTSADPALVVLTGISQLVEHVGSNNYNRVFICGGREIYNLFWEYAYNNDLRFDTLATIEDTDYGADTHVPLNGITGNGCGVIHSYVPRVSGKRLQFYGPTVTSPYADPYRELLQHMIGVMDSADTARATRNFNTYSAFGYSLRFNANTHILPPKRLITKAVIAELVMFLRGITDTTYLRDRGVHIWDQDTAATKGQMGPMYGYQWRNYNGMGVDQLRNVITRIREDRFSRRHLIAGYNPLQADSGVLYPCHGNIIQFYVDNNNRLSLAQYQRSADVVLGLPFNVLSYTLMLHMVARLTDLTVGDVVINLGDYHVYTDHYEAVHKQMLLYNEYYNTTNAVGMPVITCTTDSLENVSEADFVITNYYPVAFVSATLH